MSSREKLSQFAFRLGKSIEGSSQVEAVGTKPIESFEKLALELFALQFELNEPYRQLCQSRRRSPDHIEHWSAIPAVPTAAFKDWELSCLPEAERTAVFHSSGTTGQRPSRHFHSAESLSVYEASLLAWFASSLTNRATDFGLWTSDFGLPPFQLAILTPPPTEDPHSSLVYMFDTIRRKLGQPESVFLGGINTDGTWTLRHQAIEALRQNAATETPVLLLGTAFLFVHLLDRLAQESSRVNLPVGSVALETGGYKGRSRSLPKPELYSLIETHLGLPSTNIISEYGMSELSSQAYDNKPPPPGRTCNRQSTIDNRQFFLPPWAQVQIVSPETGSEAGEGEPGLIRVFDLANVFSVMAVQTEDLAIRRGDGFELLGRAELAEPRGCSLMAG